MSSQPTGPNRDDPWPGWGVYRGLTGQEASNAAIPDFPEPPPWRQFPRHRASASMNDTADPLEDYRGATYRATRSAVEMVNAALYLRHPLLVTGKPGSGKSSLPYAVAHELRLGPVLRWNITSRTTLKDGLYHYDVLGRLNDYNMKRARPPIGDYIDLGPLATALLPSARPRALLIDEIDKADIDLPNDLLNIFEEGYFDIPELAREHEEKRTAKKHSAKVRVMSWEGDKIWVSPGRIYCTAFPFVVLTSNGEREFPLPFLRRCLRLYLPAPDQKLLARIVDAHLPLDPNDPKSEEWRTERNRMILDFVRRAQEGDLATDQLMNAVFMTVGPNAVLDTLEPGLVNEARLRLQEALTRHLTSEAVPDMALEKAADAALDGQSATTQFDDEIPSS